MARSVFHSIAIWIGRALALLLMTMAAFVIAVWFVGELFSNSYRWSQWLAWIPTLAAIAAALLGLCMAVALALLWRKLLQHRRRWFFIGSWAAVLLVTVSYFALIEHRLLSPCGDGASSSTTDVLRIMHWNCYQRLHPDHEQTVQSIAEVDADVTVLTHPERLLADAKTRTAIEAIGRVYVVYPFAMITDHPVIETRLLIANAATRVVLFIIDTGDEISRPLTILAIDLPSDPEQSRMNTALQVRQLLDQIDAPRTDVVLGDFNMERGSTAVAHLYPDHVHAFDVVGCGYGATYPRPQPLYHIDHMLVDEALQQALVRYRIADPGVSRHRLQYLDLRLDELRH